MLGNKQSQTNPKRDSLICLDCVYFDERLRGLSDIIVESQGD
uniref:Uncharacterized protein n=1 Tax=Anguilla anguilla TaxID=7936 RepID=A0A0E9UP22_ANGAN